MSQTSSPHRFKPGQSGNPGGRPKLVREVRDLARRHTEDAIKTLAALMQSTDQKISLTAAQCLLDRAWGRPEVSVLTTNTEAPPARPIENRIVPGMTAQQCADAYQEMLREVDAETNAKWAAYRAQQQH